MPPKKYYAIAAGRKPGIYDNWPAAQAQVIGFPGARFKGFPSRAEAESWLRNPPATRPAFKKTVNKTANRPPSAATGSTPRPGEITIYTDGGARFNPGPGGYGIVMVTDGCSREISGGFRLTTNNRMELVAVIVALQALETRDQPITLYSDSSYVVNGISKGWAKNWRRRGWVKADKQPAINPDLWAKLLDLVEPLDIRFRWVKGHAGHPMNERCDELAVAAAHRGDLPPDPGYKGENG